MTVLYPNPCNNEVFYKGTVLYTTELAGNHKPSQHKKACMCLLE